MEIVIGVIIGAVLSWIPLLWRLKYESKESERRRLMALRRDVYLFMAEKIGQQLSYLAGFYQTRETSPEGYDEAITKVYIIGSNETVTAISEFQDYMVETFMELIPQKEEIRFLEQSYNYISEHTGKDLGEAQESIKEFKKIYNEQIKLTYELAGKCYQKAQLAEELLTPLIIAIRKELDTPFDEGTYREMIKTSQNRWEKNVEKYIISMKEKQALALKWIEGLEQEAEDG